VSFNTGAMLDAIVTSGTKAFVKAKDFVVHEGEEMLNAAKEAAEDILKEEDVKRPALVKIGKSSRRVNLYKSSNRPKDEEETSKKSFCHRFTSCFTGVVSWLYVLQLLLLRWIFQHTSHLIHLLFVCYYLWQPSVLTIFYPVVSFGFSLLNNPKQLPPVQIPKSRLVLLKI
jgi:hypothetical protein